MRIRNALIGTTGLMLLAAVAVPTAASADDSGATVTTFALEGGVLSVTASPAADLLTADTGDATISGSLGAMSVSDLRGGTDGWVASVSSSAFALTGGTTIDAAKVKYATGTATSTGDSVVTEADSADLTDAGPVVTATDVIGNNTAAWAPTLTVTLPSNALAGDYSGTVTTSVA